jgi:hypothetical protein
MRQGVISGVALFAALAAVVLAEDVITVARLLVC